MDTPNRVTPAYIDENHNVVILRGLPGSGKTEIVRRFQKYMPPGSDRSPWSDFSTDHYFINSDTKKYEFDSTKLKEAHGRCFKAVFRAAEEPGARIIVDNTNISPLEIAPYWQIAMAFGMKPMILNMQGDREKSFTRQTHGVSREIFDKMIKIYDGAQMAPWWYMAALDEACND